MIDPDEFDAFYKDARTRLLLQTFALTGDLPASRSAVRDAFIVSWHHWRKVSRLPDAEGWARPHAWSSAQHRHTARIWHRDKSLDADVKATLDALGKLPMPQRKALVLNQLTSVSMSDMAREIGLPRAEAERQLQTATALFSVHRNVPTTNIRRLFEPLRERAEQVLWPRPTIVRRAGAVRRRTHSLIGAGVVVATLLVSGSLVTDAAGVRPSLARVGTPVLPGTTPSTTPSPTPTTASPDEFTADTLLRVDQVAGQVPGRQWRVTRTSDNTEGDGLVHPCQQTRFADRRGIAGLVRQFGTTPRSGGPKVEAVQSIEISGSGKAARKAYGGTVDWYAGCVEPRVQLMSTQRVEGVGDDASLLVLRSWASPMSTYVAAVARTGRLTTTTTTTTAPGAAEVAGSARLLAAAVNELCGQPGAGSCATKPRLETVAPRPVGMVPGMLVEVDLPPVMQVTKPWVGTEPRKALVNVAATSCDEADFSRAPISNNLTRSFLIPDARLPDEFGLTETVGTLPGVRARAFVAEVRTRMSACSEKDLGTEVTRVAHEVSPPQELSVWRVVTELSDQESVSFLMGIARAGTAIGQVGFVPYEQVTMAPGAFIALVRRATERLPAMPPR